MTNESQFKFAEREKIILKLFIAGMSENSLRAIQNITRFFKQYPDLEYDLEIIDIYKDPAMAERQSIIFSPSLIRQFPLPQKIFIGDLSDTEKLISGLCITPKE